MRRGLAAALAAVMVITAVPSTAAAQESHFASRGEVVQLLMEAAAFPWIGLQNDLDLHFCTSSPAL